MTNKNTIKHAVEKKCTCESREHHVIIKHEWLTEEYEGVRLYCIACNSTWLEA